MKDDDDPMPDLPRDETVLDFLKTRRSVPWNMLTPPAPGGEALEELLEIASRVPDHGMLVPWRFLVIAPRAGERLSALALKRGSALGIEEEKCRKVARMFAHAPLIVAVVFTPKESEKAPKWEQRLTNGAVCLTLLNAALAAGWGANWLTGWVAQDRGFLEEGLGLAPGEELSGFIHIGAPGERPAERARPDVAGLVSRLDA